MSQCTYTLITPSARRRHFWRLQYQRGRTIPAPEPTPNEPETRMTNQSAAASAATAAPEVEEIQDLHEELRLLLDANRTLTQAAIAREANVSSTTFSQWLNRTYPGNNEAVENKLRTWLESYRQRQSASGLPAAPEWIETPSGERMLAGLRYAQLASDMVVIYGGAGLGKTKSIERYHRIAPNVFVATMTPAVHGVLGCLEEIAIGMGLREFPHSAPGLSRTIISRLRSTNGLLVIDEAQHLNVQALDQVRSIHDAARVGIALVGNEQVYTRMSGGTRAAYLDRLFSRIGKRIALRRSTEADIDAVIDAWGIADRDCRRHVHDIASKPGALRVLTKVLRLAASYAQAQARSLCCDDVRAAWKELGGLE